jgi:hypothetical protein
MHFHFYSIGRCLHAICQTDRAARSSGEARSTAPLSFSALLGQMGRLLPTARTQCSFLRCQLNSRQRMFTRRRMSVGTIVM